MLGKIMSRKGFAPVELLVTIVIIVVLGSMLLPGLSQVREKTRQGICISNLKNIVTGWLMYAEDNNGYLVPGSVKVANTGKGWEDTAVWPSMMQDYLDDPKVKEKPPYTPYGAVQITPEGILTCPSFEKVISYGGGNVHYGMNIWATEVSRGGWDTIHKIPRPSETVIFVDSRSTSGSYGWYVAGPDWAQQYVDYRHSGGANAAFADGHCEWMKKEKLTTSGSSWKGIAPWQPK